VTIARVALPINAEQAFDYWLPAGLEVKPGSVVRVRLGRKALLGVVVACTEDSAVDAARLAPIDEISPLTPLPADVLELAGFVAGYYQAPLGLALALALPPLAGGVPARRREESPLALTVAGRAALSQLAGRSSIAAALHAQIAALPNGLTIDERKQLSVAQRRVLSQWRKAGHVAAVPALRDSASVPQLNLDQRDAAAAIIGKLGTFAPFLLQGITGSGKTEVYLTAAAEAIARGGQVLVLVPEINLTPQFEARVRAALPSATAVSLHSGLAAGDRRAAWQAAYDGTAALVLGTRLAVFTPLPRLALIVVDEEHDASFKQQEGVRYHARDVAVFRARQRDVPIVLGSATPALESWHHARQDRYQRLLLTTRASPGATLPRTIFAPDRDARAQEGLGSVLLAGLRRCLARGEQALVFVNRRGYAPSYKCTACGWEAGCPRCSARLTVHRDARQLRCHHCGHIEQLHAACPTCGNIDLLPRGIGTQRLERALASALPSARIARIDRDSTRRRGAFASLRTQVEEGTVDVLVGTQMLAKGHDFPRLTLVGVLGADNALYSADFRATERAAALLMQVAGRAGRAGLAGEVIVQTDFPDHAVYRALATDDYDRLADTLLHERKIARLPPCAYVGLLLAQAHARADVDRFLGAAHAAALALEQTDAGVEIFSPVPALMARRAGFERGQMVVQSNRRGELQRFLTRWRATLAAVPSSRVRFAIDVDPMGF
jgi:primosomal protein N' (replication factor Y) (superfamily II helicase)